MPGVRFATAHALRDTSHRKHSCGFAWRFRSSGGRWVIGALQRSSLTQRVNAYQPRVQPWGWNEGYGCAPQHSMCPKGSTHTSPGCNPGDWMVGMHPGHGWWVWMRDTEGGDGDARRFGGWDGASHESQGVALGCHILPRWGRNRSRASPPNPGQPVHKLHGSTLTQRLQAR